VSVSSEVEWRLQAEGIVLIQVALAAASGLTLLTLRSLAYALAHSIDQHPRPVMPQPTRCAGRAGGYLASREAAMLIVEIALSLGIALAIIGLAATAALPGRLMIGALLAQMAVLGSLFAPPASVGLLGVRVRPAALALGIAQLANLVFFLKAIQSLI
jgi:hypothetical protein